jgi:mannosyltransferase OCH1-like enzyme
VLAFLYAVMFVFKVFLLIPYPSDPIVQKHMSGEFRQDAPFPKILHRSWKTDKVPIMWQPAYHTCQRLNTGYTLMLWTDAKIDAFFDEHYPWFKEQFESYKYIIQKMDVFRLFVVYHYGGVYMDLDIQCNVPFDEVLRDVSGEQGVVMPATWHPGVLNELIIAKPHHPFLKHVISKLRAAHHEYVLHYYTILASTGPLFVSRCLEAYPERARHVYQMPMRHAKFQYFEPVAGDTWQRWDMWLVNWWLSWLAACALGFCLIAYCVLRCFPASSCEDII